MELIKKMKPEKQIDIDSALSLLNPVCNLGTDGISLGRESLSKEFS